ncbi:MAG: efflux RND transporter periplasmic adaptor subunit [Thermoanaerobaculia bacterium]
MSGRARFAAIAGLLVLSACKGKPEAADSSHEPPPAVPVRAQTVTIENFSEIVRSPGKISVLAQQKLRTPFAGTLSELRVTDGDDVKRGQILGSVIARDSEAALAGAREMERQAATPGEKSDAARAVVLAERNLVRAPLRATVDGIVLSHAAAAGDRVSEDAEIVTIAESASMVFVADVPQSSLSRIHAGEPAAVALSGRPAPLSGSVHDILSAANTADLTIPVRIDFHPVPPRLSLGMFGEAAITVGEQPGAAAVPDAAILRNDVTGVSRIVLVTPQEKAHWIAVTTGLSQGGKTQIVSPPLAPGQKILVSGQVGLPEGSPLSLLP